MKKLWMLALTMIMLLSLAACAYDGPPREDTPEPAALEGTFFSGESSLTFNGDGSSIVLKIDEEMAKKTALPEGESEGTYVFLLSSGKYRYDKAENFRILLGKTQYQFLNAHGTTNADTVAFYPPDADEMIVFTKGRRPNC